ncbi:DNA-binding transcriptional LysR family regulator [Rhizobium skierniewicense]|uniref:HTH-type transcriptional regulator TtuA n=1 Tax=Rhizobium skierniewicense TaxID=984260 RepID=A0A7W6G114_9HYPH|nr:LysR family transcriptional regulator [Rhizobium skierniewicense]MBB3945498.1 DNA-binding transcriptional LysR family regulator [Rhizobium skierniewicense]NTF33982.1 LysR family transcriptional regulator [Rhizobium skierniewicense]
MDQLAAMRVFARVVETGNFTRAASALDMPKTTVTNMIQGLEAHLRTTLLNRTTRRVMVTTDGALYYERAIQILSEVDELDASLSNANVQPSGRLRVEMAGAFADHIIIPNLCDFHERFPLIRLDIGVGDRLVDYIAENVDCALRVGTPRDQSLIARKVSDLHLVTCASPGYIERFGMPLEPEELEENHYSVGYFNATTGHIMTFAFDNGTRSVEVSPRYILSANDSRTYQNAVLAGMGVGQLAPFAIRGELAKGNLVRILPEWKQEPMPIYIVYPQTKHVTNKVRVFVDWLAKLLHKSSFGEK